MLMKDPNTKYALELAEKEHMDLAKKISEEIKEKLKPRFLMLEKRCVVREVK